MSDNQTTVQEKAPAWRPSKSSVVIALVGGLLCLVTWAVAFHQIGRERDEAVDKEISKNGNLAQSQVDRLSTSFQVFDKVLLALRQDYLRHGKTESVNDWVSALQVNRDYVGIVSVIGADGEVISTTSPGMNLNFADREYFKTHQAQAADVLLIGRAVKGRQTGKWVISLTRRLNRPDGSFSGVIFMALDPSFISQGFEKLQLPPDAAIALFGMDRRGRIRFRNGQVALDEDYSNFPIFKEMVNRSSGHYISHGSPLDNQRRVINFAMLDDYPLAVLVSSSLDDVIRSVAHRERTDYAAAAIVTLLILALMTALLMMQAANERSVSALAKSEKRLRAIIDLSPVPMAVSDAMGRISFLNQAFVQTFGYQQEDVPTVAVWWPLAFPDPDYRQKVFTNWWAELEKVQRTASVFSPMDVELRGKDGTVKSVVVSATGLPKDSGDEHLIVLYDITQRKAIERELQLSLQHQEALMKEIHHRVKNNLQVIASLLRLEAGRQKKGSAPALAMATVLSDMQGRIRSMALLHESLYRAGTMATVDLGAYLKQLVILTFRAQSGMGEQIQLRINVVPVTVGMEQATSLGLLTNELISNSLKHGFPDGRIGEIQFDLAISADEKQCTLQVSDTGVGLSDDFEARRKSSLGLQLVNDLCGQVGGTLTMGRGGAGGLMTTVTFAPLT